MFLECVGFFLQNYSIQSVPCLYLLRKNIKTSWIKCGACLPKNVPEQEVRSSWKVCFLSQYSLYLLNIIFTYVVLNNKELFLIYRIHFRLLEVYKYTTKSFYNFPESLCNCKCWQITWKAKTSCNGRYTNSWNTNRSARAIALVTVKTHRRPVCMGRDGQKSPSIRIEQN